MVKQTLPFSRGLPAAGVRVAALWSAAVMRRAILISLCLALAGGAQVIRVGDVAQGGGLTTTDIKGANPFALGRAIDAFLAAARGKSSDRVIVASADKPAFAMPAAGYSAKTGDPVLFVNKDTV